MSARPAPGAIVWGRLADRIGRRRTFFWCVVMFVGFTALTLATPERGWWMLALLRVGVGIGVGGLNITSIPYVQEFVPTKHRGLLAGLGSVFIPLGLFLGSVAQGVVGDNWRLLIGLGCVPVLLLIWLRVVPESPRFHQVQGDDEGARRSLAWALQLPVDQVGPLPALVNEETASYGVVFRRYLKPLLVITVGSFCFIMGGFAVQSWGQTLLKDGFGYSVHTVALLFMVVSLVDLLGRLASAFLADVIGRRVTMFTFGLLGAGGCLLAAFSHSSGILFFIAICIIMAFGDGAFGILNAFGAEQFPNSARSTGLGLGYGIGATAKIIGPALLGAGPTWQAGRMSFDFWSAVDHGFARVAACTLGVRIADPHANAAATLKTLTECDAEAVHLAVFPELGLSGYAIDDLLLQDALLDAVVSALDELRAGTAELATVAVVGAPLRHGNRLFNCAVVLHCGRILGVVPKSYLPNYREFYERRHFAPGDDQWGQTIELCGSSVPFGPDLIFDATDLPGFSVHVEICEDLWVPVAPGAEAALAGATILANLSGSPITVGKADSRHLLCRAASARCLSAYLYAAAGVGESSTDLSWDGQTMIYENGTLLAETERFPQSPQRSVADVDLGLLRTERLRQGSFDDNRRTHADRLNRFRHIEFALEPRRGDFGLCREIARYPFVPSDVSQLAQDCYEAYAIQVSGLEQRLREIGQPKIVIGVSGGLDSTHALIVAARAMDRMGRPRGDILAYTMPGFATSEHTRNNATRLAEALGVSFEAIDITPAARQMLADLDHPTSRGEEVYDVTFENVQAGLRTDYLFRLANHLGGIVLGTGDLSELALGWCTYGVGDQMSHYAVNTGVPKTLIQHLIRWVIAEGIFSDEVGEILRSILNTEITPELVPTRAGEQPQSTEASIGPYALQDFTLYHVLRFGMSPAKIAFLAWHSWHDAESGRWPANIGQADHRAYDLATIRRWLEVFCKRFFAFSQFKRSALPNGPKVSGGGALSPRGDWRMPSDANANAWLADLTKVPRG